MLAVSTLLTLEHLFLGWTPQSRMMHTQWCSQTAGDVSLKRRFQRYIFFAFAEPPAAHRRGSSNVVGILFFFFLVMHFGGGGMAVAKETSFLQLTEFVPKGMKMHEEKYLSPCVAPEITKKKKKTGYRRWVSAYLPLLRMARSWLTQFSRVARFVFPARMHRQSRVQRARTELLMPAFPPSSSVLSTLEAKALWRRSSLQGCKKPRDVFFSFLPRMQSEEVFVFFRDGAYPQRKIGLGLGEVTTTITVTIRQSKLDL